MIPRGTLAAVWMGIAQVSFALMNVAGRSGAEELPWQEVATARFLMGTIVAFTWARIRGKPLRVVNQRLAWRRTGFGLVAAAATFYTLASHELPVGDGVTIMATSPIFVALLSYPLLGEPVRMRVLVAMVVSFAGIAAVAQPSFHVARVAGTVAMSVAVFSALAMISLRKLGPGESAEAVVLHFSAFGFLILLAITVPVWKMPSPRAAGFLLLTGVAGGVGQLAMTRAYSLERAAKVASLAYLGVVFTRLFAVPFFGEVPAPAQVVGSVLVIGAGLFVALDRAPAR
ncbi:MAG: DMT family transporter [Polyangiaceae bacterium]